MTDRLPCSWDDDGGSKEKEQSTFVKLLSVSGASLFGRAEMVETRSRPASPRELWLQAALNQI